MYKKIDISSKGIPHLANYDLLKSSLKKFANEEYYSGLPINKREGEINPYSHQGDLSSMRFMHTSDRKEIIRLLKKCFPNITFRLSGFFIYGPGDYLSEHTNADDPRNTMYITYAAAESSFSYRFHPSEEFIKTEDAIDDITLRTFSLKSEGPFTHHKVDSENGYRVSIGMRYVQIK